MGGTAPALPLESLEKLLLAAEEAGVPRARLLAAAGLADADASSGVSFEALAAAYEQAARLTADSNFGLHVGERTDARMYGLLGYIAANARDLGEALASLVEFQALWSQAAGFELEPRRDHVRIRYWHDGAVPAERRRHESEQMLGALLTFIRSALAAPVAPLEVGFEHEAPGETVEHRRVFACRLRFGAPATQMLLPAALLGRPIPAADATLAGLMRRQAQAELGRALGREPFLERAQALVRAAILGSADISLAALAEALGTGPRTLQRRLRRHGLTHRRLIDETRMALAERMLEDPRLPLALIAFRLGYSQTSAFHRAFRRLRGTTPRGFRNAVARGRL